MTAPVRETPTRVLLLGFGAVGRHLAQLLAPEREAGQLTLRTADRDPAAHARSEAAGIDLVPPGPEAWTRAVAEADLVVECAGVAAATDLGPSVVAAGTDLVLTSVGALATLETARALLAGPGRLWVTNGAIGGFDTLGAAAEAGGLDTVRIRTSKLPSSLVQPWMTAEDVAQLRAMGPGDAPFSVFLGGPTEAIELFPANVNVAVGLAWATRGLPDPGADPVPAAGPVPALDEAELLAAALTRVEVELVADPSAALSRHEVFASGAAGRFAFTFESAPSPENPKTSGMTALSVARTIRRALATRRG
jgi:aspartate dehydrogenase